MHVSAAASAEFIEAREDPFYRCLPLSCANQFEFSAASVPDLVELLLLRGGDESSFLSGGPP